MSESQYDDPNAIKAGAQAAGLHVTSKLATSFIGLAIIFVLTRLLAKDDFGRFALLYGLYDVLEMLLALGIPACLLFLIPVEDREKARSIGFGAALLLTGGALVDQCCWTWPPSHATGLPYARSVARTEQVGTRSIHIGTNHTDTLPPSNLLCIRTLNKFSPSIFSSLLQRVPALGEALMPPMRVQIATTLRLSP